MASKKVAVLGAGPMGLAVAYQLVKSGYSPVAYEADDRVGGMAACFNFNGLMIERYYHFHCTSDKEFFTVLGELGLEDQLNWVETKMGYYFQKKVIPWGNPFSLLKFPGVGPIAKFRYGLHAFLSTKRRDWESLDKLEATSWIKKWVGAKAYEIFWAKLFEYKFYQYSDQLSAAWIWSRIKRIGNSRFNIFKEKLGYVNGGSDTLLNAMKDYIVQNGGEIKLFSPVEKVLVEKGQIKGVQVAGQALPYQEVVSTIPLSYIPRLIPDLPTELNKKYQALKNVAVVCVIAKLRKRMTENFWLNVNDPDMDIPGMVEYSNLRPLEHHIVYVPFYMPGDHPKYQESDQQFTEKVSSYIRFINPDIQESDILDIRASRYRYAQPVCPPGFLDSLPDYDLPVDGLWAADTSYYYPEDRGISESIGFGRMLALKVIE